MVLTEKQKEYLFTEMFKPYDLAKIFDTCNISWLVAQKVELKDDGYGWLEVLLSGTKYTSLNPSVLKKQIKHLKTLS